MCSPAAQLLSPAELLSFRDHVAVLLTLLCVGVALGVAERVKLRGIGIVAQQLVQRLAHIRISPEGLGRGVRVCGSARWWGGGCGGRNERL